jgi:hypothetical protein
MKKYLLFFCYLLVIFIGTVKAENVFVHDWKTEEHISTVSYYSEQYTTGYVEYEFSYLLYNNYYPYMNGYVTSEEIYDAKYDTWETLVTYYDKNGKILVQNSDYDFTVDDLLVFNDVIYVVAYDSKASSNPYSVKTLDDKLKVRKSSVLSNYSKYWDIYTRKYYGLDFMSDNGQNVLIYTGNTVYEVDPTLSQSSYSRATTFDVNNLEFMRFRILKQLYGDYKGGITAYISSNIVGENETILSGAYFDEECTTYDANNPCCVTSYIISSFDNDNNMLWSLDSSKYLGITDVSYVGDYLVGLANKQDEDGNIVNLILVLDKKGNVVQEIVRENRMMMLRSTNNGFMVLSYQDKDQNDLTKYNIEVYTYAYEIITKTDGNGTVVSSFVETSEGKEVQFTINPKKGYVLGEVKVTDANGNNVVFNDYTFTMPSSDVTIEVTFVKDVLNPNTVDITIIGVVILFILGIVSFVLSKKKMNWLNS